MLEYLFYTLQDLSLWGWKGDDFKRSSLSLLFSPFPKALLNLLLQCLISKKLLWLVNRNNKSIERPRLRISFCNSTVHRDRLQILAEILNLCRKPRIKTNIMHKNARAPLKGNLRVSFLQFLSKWEYEKSLSSLSNLYEMKVFLYFQGEISFINQIKIQLIKKKWHASKQVILISHISASIRKK
jgi:hypothetical protein